MKRLVVTDNRINTGFIVMVICTGVFCLSLHWLAYYEVMRAASWPSVDAVVSHCEVSTSSEIHYGAKTGPRVIQRADLSFQFTYAVGGHSYVSTRFYAWGQPSAYWAAREYPFGQHFTARYNPNDPAEAVVEPGSTGQAFLIASLILFGLATICLIYNFYLR